MCVCVCVGGGGGGGGGGGERTKTSNYLTTKIVTKKNFKLVTSRD